MKKKSPDEVVCYLCPSTIIHNLSRNKNTVPLCVTCFSKSQRYECHQPKLIIRGDDRKGIIKTGRAFGIELESFCPDNVNFNIGLYKAPDGFGFSPDGSISGSYSMEIKTCPLVGKEGEQILKDYLTELTDVLGWKTNTSCGTHCHIAIPEAQKSTPAVEAKLKNLAILYTIFDPVIRSLLPRDRRNNVYCAPLRAGIISVDATEKKLVEAHQKAKTFAELLYKTTSQPSIDHYKLSRNVVTRGGINFQSMYFRGTLEVRYHQGSLDPVQLIHWIALHSAMVELAMSGKITEEQLMEYAEIKTLRRLLDCLIELVTPLVDKTTVKYTLARYNKYRYLNPIRGYIPESRVDAKKIKKQQEDAAAKRDAFIISSGSY